MSAVLPLNLAPNAPPDLATAYWRALCSAAGYLDDNSASITALAGLVGAMSVNRITFPLPLPNAAYVLNFAAGSSVLINGTTNPGQFVVQATGAIVQVNPFGPGSVNSYDLIAALAVASALYPLLNIISPAAVLYTGHSLGGAVAQLLAQRPQVFPVVGSWTAGQPRVGTSLWALGYTVPAERYTTPGDPVPAVPPSANALVDLTLQAIWPFVPTSYRHVGTRRHVLANGSISSPPETPSWQEGMEYLIETQLGSQGWYGAHSPATYAARIRQGIPVPWMGTDPAWPLIGQLDALAVPLLGDLAGVPSAEQFTTASVVFDPRSRFATQGICQ